MDAINNFAQKLEGVPGYDMAVDWINDKAGEKYQTKGELELCCLV